MKHYALIIALFLYPLDTALGSIENGFYREKSLLENQIKHYKSLLTMENDRITTRQIERKIARLQKKHHVVAQKFYKTQRLISQLKQIDALLYKRVSGITNAEGTLTHVYVRYVSRTSEEFTYLSNTFYPAKAYTSVRQSKDNKNVCTSLYGTNTITITIGYGCDEILALGHEFAHVIYIVPNIREYFDYWRSKQSYCDGHDITDPSYFTIKSIEVTFRRNYLKYKEMIKNNKLVPDKIASLN